MKRMIKERVKDLSEKEFLGQNVRPTKDVEP